MKHFTDKIILLAKKTGNALLENGIAKRIVTGALTFSVAFSPVVPEITILADEVRPDSVIEETVSDPNPSGDISEAVMPDETIISDNSESDIRGPVFQENDDLIVPDPSDTFDTTAPPTEQTEETVAETTAEQPQSKIVEASSADEYYKLIAELPEGYQRIIVDTYADLSNLEVSCGVYFDGTYILVFDDGDSFSKAVKSISDAGYEYAIDGTLSICGKRDGSVYSGNINPDAKVKVAVIDTGSALYNEAFSVIGEDLSDHNGHGTAMCDLILNETDDAYIISIKAIGDDGKGSISDVYAAVQLAEDLGVDYILMALSIRNAGKYDAFISLIENTKATVVASAGNNGTDASKYLPAGINSVVTVGALNEDKTLRSSSNYGDRVDYYVVADSTSEAASIALGKIIDERTSELLTEPVENTDDSVEGEYYLFAREEDGNLVFVTDREGPSSIAITLGGTISLTTYFRNVPGNTGTGWYYDYNYDSSVSSTASSHVYYCIEHDAENPVGGYYWDYDYSGTKNGLAYVFAFCPQGDPVLYEVAKQWWKDNGSSVLKNPSNVGSAAMYAITHFCACYVANGYWPSDTPTGTNGSMSIWNSYLDYIYGIYSSGKVTYGGNTYTIYNGWAEYYHCVTDTSAWGTSPSDYQLFAVGGAKTRINNTPTPTPTNSPTPTPTNSPTPTPTNTPTPTPTPFQLSLTKASSDTAVTDGNSAYSLAGAKYVLATDTSFSNAATVGTFTMKADGKTDTNLTVNKSSTYYLKETVAATGYELDTSVYKITISANGTATVSTQSGSGTATVTQGNPILVNVKDQPKISQISLTKASSAPGVTGSNTCYSLANTSYGLYATKADANAKTNALATFTVNANGVTTITYTTAYGMIYYLRETAAGKGYELDNKIYTVSVSNSGAVTVDQGVSTNLSGGVYYMNLTDVPGRDPLNITLKKVDKNGNVVHNADLSGAIFRFSYYAQDLGASGNTNVKATVIYNITLSGSSSTIKLSDLRNHTPAGGSDPNYLKNLPADWDRYPYGTIRIQEITAPAGYKVNDQVVRYRLGSTVSYSVENNSSYSNRNYWKQLADGSLELTELPEIGYYSLTKSLADTDIRSSVSGFTYELYNTSSKSSPVQIATGVSQSDGRVLWTYTIADYYQNSDPSKLLTGTTTYQLELPATEKTSSGAETAIVYQVREITSSIGIAYGNTGIPYTYAAPVTNGKAWNKADGYYYKTVSVSDEAVTREGVTNDYHYTGLSVSKVVPSNNPFDVTKVSFKVWNTDGGKETLFANGTVDSNGNVTWHRTISSGYGSSPATSVNVLNYLPLGHYRVEETWNKDYVDASGVSFLIEEKNNSGWTKTETDTTYTYSKAVDLSSSSNDGKITSLTVENESLVQEFNLTKTVMVAGDASTVTAELYLLDGTTEKLVATGTCTTNGIGTYGFTWDYKGTHTTRDNLDTLVLPVGKYRIVEICPVTCYKNTKVPYTYKTPEGYASRSAGGKLQFYKDFELKSGSYETLRSSVTNVRIEGSFDIIKVERSGDGKSKTFTFEVYYRGNGNAASNDSTLIETVRITTSNGKGFASLKNLPEGWYEIREAGAGSSWATHWINEATVSNGNKVIRLDSDNRTNAAPTVNDSVKSNGSPINAVVVYNDTTPEIRTTLVDKETSDHVSSCSSNTTLEDTVSYTNLLPGHYVISGVLMDQETGKELLDKNGNKITAVKEFNVASETDEYGEVKLQSGSVKVSYTLDTTSVKDVTVVAFEELHKTSATGTLVAEHADIDDAAQTVYIPDIKTTLVDSEIKEHISSCSASAKLVDTVSYSNLLPGKLYTLSGELMDKNTGKALGISSSVTFTPASASGTIELEFTVDTTKLKGVTAVAFDTVSLNGKTVAIHNNINDIDQTVDIPDIGTNLVDSETKDHVSSCSKTAKLVDTITYKNLVPGKEYEVKGELMDKTTRKSLGITASKKFTPDKASGTVTIEFTVDTTKLKGISVVAFETVSYKGIDVAIHADINDAGQTVEIPDIGTTLLDSKTDDHISSYGKTTTLVDTVSYKNLIPGKEYTVTGELINKTTGKSTGITASQKFKPEKASGKIDIKFTVDTTAIKGITVVAYEKVLYKDFEIAIHTDINDKDQTLDIPEIGTTLLDEKTNAHISAYAKTTKLVDTVSFKNLMPGKSYVVTGTLMDKKTGESLGITASKTFTADKADGIVEIEFYVDTTIVKGVTIVAFETLSYKDIEIAVHADINDVDQTVDTPDIKTAAADKDTGDKVVGYKTVNTIVDTVKYSGLIAGKTYTVSGILVDKKTGDVLTDPEGKAITASSEFKAENAEGSVEIEFSFDSTVLAGKTIVAFETMTFENVDVAVHADIDDEDQTVYVPEIKTTLIDPETKDHVAAKSEKTKLVDTVSYKNLIPGKEYTLTGTLMDKNTGKELKDTAGNTYTVSKTFTPESADGTVDIGFVVDTTMINDVTAVAFENLYHNDVLVAVHADIKDVDQTVYIPKIRTTLTDSVTNDHVGHEETISYVVKLVDTVRYTNLLPGKNYTVIGELVNKKTGEKIVDENSNVITSSVSFTADTIEGSVDIVFLVDYRLLRGKTVVAFEDLRYNDIEVAAHADIKDEDQTVYFPEIHTVLLDTVTKEHVVAQSETIKLVDTVAYTNLKPGYEYTMKGVLMDKSSGTAFLDKDGNEVRSEVVFMPDTESGFVEMTFEFDGSILEGDSLVAFEEYRFKDETVATHNDISDIDQTVDIPDIRTTFFDKEIGEDNRFARTEESVTLVDRVYYRNVRPGLEYTLYGTVMVKETGEALKDENGNTVVNAVSFTTDTSDGFIDVEFTVNTKVIAGQTLVAFETLDYNGVSLVIHADIEDVDQTIHIPEIWTTAVDADNKTHTLTYKDRVTVVDTVAYKNLIPGRTYVVEGTLYNAETGEIYKDVEGKTYTAATEFEPAEADGTVDVIFENVLVSYEKTRAVVFEDLTDKETKVKITTHSDINDETQTVERPTAVTTATVDGEKEIWLASAEVRNITITDTIFYTGLEVGNTYRAEATLYKSDGTQLMNGGMPLTSIVLFVPEAKDGTIDVSITFSTSGLSEGDHIVVFEKIYDVATETDIANGTQKEDILIAKHEDLNDEDQTITIHFRPSTGEITPIYIKIGAALLALSTFALSFLIRRKKKITN